MDSLHLNTGGIRLAINDDPNRVIEFNPEDLSFAERFYSLLSEFEAKEKEYQAQASELNKNTEVDGYGIPKNFGASLDLLHETCTYLRKKIDSVFGEGTSQKAFGTANTLTMFEQFFVGLTPYVQHARDKQVQKYTTRRRNKPGVLK